MITKTLGILIDGLAECAFDACDLDGWQCTELLQKAGLVVYRKATAEDVTENSDYEVGDDIWVLTDFAKDCRRVALEKAKNA